MEFNPIVNPIVKNGGMCINCKDYKVYHPINGCDNYKQTNLSIYSWIYSKLKYSCENTRTFVNDNKYLLISPVLIYTMVKSPIQVLPVALFVSLYSNLHLLTKK